MNKHPDCNQGHGSNRQQHHSTCDHHAHRGSHWAESKAAHRFRAQSAQFDTGTKSFLKYSQPSASQLILAKSIMKVEAPRTVKSGPNLLHRHIRSPNMSGLPRIRSHNKLGISCVHRCMDGHPKRNQTIVFGLLWRTL
jgi:hypothetical protein